MGETQHDKLRFELLHVIGKYYPIGFTFSNHQYPGYQELLKILTAKIDTLVKDKKIKPWCDVVEKVKIRFPGNEILDQAYIQYPCLALSVTLYRTSDEFVKRARQFHIRLSLLGPYYTIFFIEEFVGIRRSEKEIELPRRTVWYNNPTSIQEDDLIDAFKGIVQTHYPEYNFVDHNKLLKMKILGALPHGEDFESEDYMNPTFEFSAFDYLFGRHDRGDMEGG